MSAMKCDAKDIFQRFEQLKQQRASWEPLWKDIRDYVLPDYGVFEGEDPTDGSKRYKRILDSSAMEASDILSSGLYSGVSSPSRPWLRLTTLDGDLDQNPEVKAWLTEVQRTMLLIFAKAGIYSRLQQAYIELPVFGQACAIARPHPEKVINLQNMTVGEYWIAEDDYGFVDTLYRLISMTAKQMVQQWGIDNVSNDVRSVYMTNPFHRFIVLHAIEPRWERDDRKRDSLNKPWRSVYIEQGTQHVLSESGFDDFPAMCPRWMTCGGSVYGRGPGAKALSASKSLQYLQNCLADLAAYQSNPPVVFPDTFTTEMDLLRPGGRIPVAIGEQEIVRSAWEVRADANALQTLINFRQAEIQRLFYTNIFQMFASSIDQDRTATEVQALEQEKIMMLGPVLERIHSELLDPLVSSTFAFMVEQNRVPEPPEELYNRPLNIEYISVLAEQQRNSSANGILKLTQQVGMLAQLNPNALDKLDVDNAIDELADMNGVPPSLIVSGDKVALIRQSRAQQQQQENQMIQAAQVAQNIRNLTPAVDSPNMREAMEAMSDGI